VSNVVLILIVVTEECLNKWYKDLFMYGLNPKITNIQTNKSEYV